MAPKRKPQDGPTNAHDADEDLQPSKRPRLNTSARLQQQQLRDTLVARKSEWHLTDADITDAIARIEHDKAIKFVLANGDASLFLYAKGLFSSFGRARRIRDLLTDPDAEKQRERLLRIVSTGETAREVTTDAAGCQCGTFADFCKDKMPVWGSPETSWVGRYNAMPRLLADPVVSQVLFRDHEQLKDKDHAYTERVQHPALCFMHAPVVMQHYLVAMANDHRTPSLDMALFMRRYRSAAELEKHIMENLGGSSIAFLRSILLPDTELKRYRTILDDDPPDLVRQFEREWKDRLEAYGPALVRAFEVHSEFKNPDRWVYTGNVAPDRDNLPGYHAMLLVGHRRTENDETRFLLQNWWENKQFVEVDWRYLMSAKAELHYVTTPQTHIPQEFPINHASHVELEMDIAEQLELEDRHRTCVPV